MIDIGGWKLKTMKLFAWVIKEGCFTLLKKGCFTKEANKYLK
jgi:hypothetical protein